MSQPVDIERLLQIVIGSAGLLPWRGTHPRELLFSYGYTVIPKGCARAYHNPGIPLACPIGPDAQLVMAAVMELPPATAAAIIACAREERRPQWHVPPRRVPVAKRHRRKHRKVIVGYRLEPATDQAICQARAAYAEWHDGIVRLHARLHGTLSAWQINGFSAPAEPWLTAQKTSS